MSASRSRCRVPDEIKAIIENATVAGVRFSSPRFSRAFELPSFAGFDGPMST